MENLKIDDKCIREIFGNIPHMMQLLRFEMRQHVNGELTVPQFRILARLSKGEANCGELADWIGVSLPAMTKMTNLLVKRNFIKRNRLVTDRRQLMLSLTRKGFKFFSECKTLAQKSFAKKLKNISDDQKLVIYEGLKVMGAAFMQPGGNR